MATPSSSSSSSNSPQQYILAKLDTIALRILQSGQFKTHKYFRVSVPQAITGQGLVQTIQEIFSVEDVQDAIHFATILMHNGYLFPVIEQTNVVKDDNTLYRMQLPYFWPSHSPQVDNIEYAIYLNKRLMRSEQRHGLEEYEVEAFNRLVELLGHIWSFITTQAEMQLKIQKERRKAEKVVFDSEERYFWRQRRPMPGQTNYLDESIQKTERRIRKCNIQGYRQRIERLKLSIKTKPWLKAIKGNDQIIQFSIAMHDYDPFLSQPHPNNPWISEDPQLWLLNGDNVEVPTERRVKRWSLNVHELVKDPIGRQVLETFLESEFSSENLRFWMAIQDLKASPNCQTETKAKRIIEEFLAAGAPCQVNVDSRTLEETFKCLKQSSVIHRYAFSLAEANLEEHIFTLMSKDSYPRFLRSQIYNGVLTAAQQQGNRRLNWRNFVLMVGSGSSNQKKTPAITKHKVSRAGETEQQLPLVSCPMASATGTTNNNALPKQHSSDSLPVKQQMTALLPPGTLGETASPIQSPPSAKDSSSKK